MRLIELGPVWITLFGSLVLAVVLLAVRILVMQRVQSRRMRENRQETERLKSLVAAYRMLAGSFSPAGEDDRAQIEEALADIILFGSGEHVELAARCAVALEQGEPVDYQELAEALRAELRTQLGLEPIRAGLALPRSGPGRARQGRGDNGGRGGAGRGGGGAGGGGGGGGTGAVMGAGGLSAGLAAGEAAASE